MLKEYELDFLNDDFEKRVTITGTDPQLGVNPRLDGDNFDLDIDKWLRNMLLHAASFTEKAHYDKENAVKSLDMIRFCSVSLLELYEREYNIKVAKPYTE
jgi:hypothetical protein